MKYVDEFRDGDLARSIANRIGTEARSDRIYNLMEFCGGHTHAISRYGLADLLPSNVNMIHGPGCPVCVLPIGRIDNAIELAGRRGMILCTYADTMRVPASGGLSGPKSGVSPTQRWPFHAMPARAGSHGFPCPSAEQRL